MSSSQYFGLSLSDRLKKAGIVNSFATAVKSKDSSQMRSLLQSVDYSDESAEATIKTFLNSPETFQI